MPEKKQLNPFLKLALDIGPLVLFFAANAKFGIFAATGTFMMAVLIALAVAYVMTRRIEVMPVVTAVIVLVFGGLTLVLHNETFIKLKPTIIYVLFGGTLAGGLVPRQVVTRHLVRADVPTHRRRLAQADAALGAVLFRAGGAERDRLAHTDDGFLGQFQIVRRAVPLTFVFGALQYPLIKKYSVEQKILDCDLNPIWKSIATGLCGSAAHSTILMTFKSMDSFAVEQFQPGYERHSKHAGRAGRRLDSPVGAGWSCLISTGRSFLDFCSGKFFDGCRAAMAR